MVSLQQICLRLRPQHASQHAIHTWGLRSAKLPNRLVAPATSGFTLVEVIVSVAVLAVLSATVTPALLAMNTSASVARLNTLASAIALNQVELVSTDAPFSPPDEQIPVDLEVGTQTAPVIVYDDPNSNTTVEGTMTTFVEDPNYWQNGYNLHLRKITVKVTYEFRNRVYTVMMRTVRASDV